MGSVPNLDHIAAYSAMAELVHTYFTRAQGEKSMEWQTPGGMFQRYTVRKKGEDHKWDRDAVPQAYIDRNGELTIPISGVGGKTVQSFLQKNAPTLKYFWDWTKQDANTKGQDLPWPPRMAR